FAKPSGEIHSHSQSKWLKADKNEVNQVAFAAITTEPALCELTDERHRVRAGARADKIEIQLPTAKIDKAVAIRNAGVFVRKLNPSGLPSEESAALEEIRYAPRSEPDRQLSKTSPALRYGLWWHDFIQRIPWSCSDGALSPSNARNAPTRLRPATARQAERGGYSEREHASWEEIFEASKLISPDPARSLREWKLLLAHLSDA